MILSYPHFLSSYPQVIHNPMWITFCNVDNVDNVDNSGEPSIYGKNVDNVDNLWIKCG